VADDLILDVRGEDGVLRAFFNVCQHRGKQLATGAGQTTTFICRYHGWSWNTDGTTREVIDLHRDTGALFTARRVHAMKRLAEEMPTGASYMDLLIAMDRLHREEGKKDGVSWDQFTLEDVGALGLDWHVLPNMAFLLQEDGAIAYIARSNGDDPDSCVFDIYSLERFAPGQAPAFQHDVIEDWRSVPWPLVPHQDFENVGEIRAGLQSRGDRFGRVNPVAELTCINSHYHVGRLVEGRPRKSRPDPHEKNWLCQASHAPARGGLGAARPWGRSQETR